MEGRPLGQRAVRSDLALAPKPKRDRRESWRRVSCSGGAALASCGAVSRAALYNIVANACVDPIRLYTSRMRMQSRAYLFILSVSCRIRPFPYNRRGCTVTLCKGSRRSLYYIHILGESNELRGAVHYWEKVTRAADLREAFLIICLSSYSRGRVVS